MNEYITLSELAQELKLDKSNARKWIIQQGITFSKVRGAGNQLVLALSPEDAETAREIRQQQGYFNNMPVESSSGFLYIVQIMPDVIQSRVKLGYATNCQNRLKAYLTASPTATLIACWPCHISWEKAAIASLTRENCNHVGGEVYDCFNIEHIIELGYQFFSLMPQPFNSR